MAALPDATVIAAISTGLGGLILAWAQLRGQKSGASTRELKLARAAVKRLEAQVDALRRWGLRLEVRLVEERLKVPPRPAQYDVDWGREVEEESPEGDPKRMRLVGRG